MAFKPNPLTGKMDYYVGRLGHGFALSYKFVGYREEDAETDPGEGCIALDFPGGMGAYLVMSIFDKNGYNQGYTLESLCLVEPFAPWIIVQSKKNPSVYLGLYINYPGSAITEGEGDDETTVAYSFELWPIFYSLAWDEELEDYDVVDFEDDEELLMFIDMCLDMDYIGTMGTQDSDSVYIYGGSISGVTMNLTNGSFAVPVKSDTGDPTTSLYDGKMYLNTYDKKLKVYADSAWQTVLDYS